MPRPKASEEKRVQLQIRLPVTLREQLRQEASLRDVSTNYVITRAIEEWLANQGKQQ